MSGKYFYIVDDNLFCDISYCTKLFKSIINANLNKKWWIQAPITLAENDNLLNLAVESGLITCQLGLESISQTALNSAHKYQNKVRDYKKIVKKFHDFGIMVVPFFLFGFDSDNKKIFSQTVDFAHDIDCDAIAFWILTPFPGTDFYKVLNNQNRILSFNWNFYDSYHCVFQPKNMSPEELENGLFQSFENFYGRAFKFGSVLNRFKGKQMRNMIYKAPKLFIQVMNLILNIKPKIAQFKNSIIRDRNILHKKL